MFVKLPMSLLYIKARKSAWGYDPVETNRFSHIGGKPTVRTIVDPWSRLRQILAGEQACQSTLPISA